MNCTLFRLGFECAAHAPQLRGLLAHACGRGGSIPLLMKEMLPVQPSCTPLSPSTHVQGQSELSETPLTPSQRRLLGEQTLGEQIWGNNFKEGHRMPAPTASYLTIPGEGRNCQRPGLQMQQNSLSNTIQQFWKGFNVLRCSGAHLPPANSEDISMEMCGYLSRLLAHHAIISQ